MLFRAECARLIVAVATLTVAHLCALIFLSRMLDLGQQNLAVHWSFGAVYALCGGLLGLAQFLTYAKPNAWLSLIHRPLHPRRISGELVAAGLVLLALMIALPIVLTALWQDQMTARVVDTRHWLLALASWQIAACAYFCGAFAVLAPRRYAAIGLVLLFWLINAKATGPWALAVQLLALMWAAWMLAAVFKANRDATPKNAMLPAVALPTAMGVYFLALIAFVAVELIWIAWGTHPNNGVPPVGGHNEMEKTTASTRMLAVLKTSTHVDAPLLSEQVKLSEPISIGAALGRLPQAHELTNVMPMEFDDKRRGLRFVYSHDDRKLHGYRIRDGVAEVTLNLVFPDPALPFGQLPGMNDGDAVLVARGNIYHYESETQNITLRVALPNNQALLAIKPIGESFAVLSDRAIHIFDARPFISHREIVTPRTSMPLAGRFGDLSNIDAIELVDGHLFVSTYSAMPNHVHGAKPFQVAEVLHTNGTRTLIGSRALKYDFGWLYRYQGFWLSPSIYGLREHAQALFVGDDTLTATTPEPISRSAIALTIALHILALVLAFRWLNLRRVNRRWPWLTACLVFGLPMYAALLLIEWNEEKMR